MIRFALMLALMTSGAIAQTLIANTPGFVTFDNRSNTIADTVVPDISERSCLPGQVERKVIVQTTDDDLVYNAPNIRLVCPKIGDCQYEEIFTAPKPPPTYSICLTPDQELKAEAEWNNSHIEAK